MFATHRGNREGRRLTFVHAGMRPGSKWSS